MRKNGARQLTLQQYRNTDLFLFAVILLVADLLVYYAATWFPSVAFYTLSFVVPITALVIIRWGWYGALFSVADGLIYCIINGAAWQSFLIYMAGNAFAAFSLIFVKLMGKQRITSKFYFSLLFVVLVWLLINLGRAVVSAILGYQFIEVLLTLCGISENGLLSLFIGALTILVLRKFDGMWEDQKHYLKRLEEERKEKQRHDTFGEEFIEIDEETISILNKHNKDIF